MCLPHCVPCHVPNEIDYGEKHLEQAGETRHKTLFQEIMTSVVYPFS